MKKSKESEPVEYLRISHIYETQDEAKTKALQYMQRFPVDRWRTDMKILPHKDKYYYEVRAVRFRK